MHDGGASWAAALGGGGRPAGARHLCSKATTASILIH